MNYKSILGDKLDCPNCRTEMRYVKGTLTVNESMAVCDICGLKRKIVFPKAYNLAGCIGSLKR